ncbi:hypothetical protein T23_18150 [Turicibacter faecis]|uniref:site-specific DNA-methyltransferase (adenine-specific) n=1 Tax=Turicibacter faecis TaxID=2963365 RepID=A0ABN6ZLB4_9FIRM|nr:hypothetical protein T23_18150 [Turicibacter sp. TC023]
MNNLKLKILKETFEKGFDIDSFRRFIREFFNEPHMINSNDKEVLWNEYRKQINSYNIVAKYTDVEDNNLIVLAVELSKSSSIDRARSMQRNFISKILDENNIEAAIVAYYAKDESSWRLSFVRLDYSFTDKGVILDLTPARRYSYLVGENEPNHTAQSQLLPIFQDDNRNPTLDEIEVAFSVEKVTRDFFQGYKEKYLELKEYLEKSEGFIFESNRLGLEVCKFSEQFSKKLMGQLAFLYFLQKKGWLGVDLVPYELNDEEYINLKSGCADWELKILEEFYSLNHNGNYILKKFDSQTKKVSEYEIGVLSDIFFRIPKYNNRWGSGNKNFISKFLWKECTDNQGNFFNDYLEPLFYEALNNERKNQYFYRLNCKIPFLNGGLFEPLQGYNWKANNFNIPNKFFSNKNLNSRKSSGILDIFDRFNFTINEDEPLEKEVAVDPEMLGKIFENLLDVKDRRSKGAFYTPRVIVHHMCQETLTNYLSTEVGIPIDDVKEFILYGDLIRDVDRRKKENSIDEYTLKPSIWNNLAEIDRALDNIRIADPSVGSGAFPLGMLNEIVKARNNITEYLVSREAILIEEDIIRYESKRSIYELKLRTIQNCIFAVDIEESAVDITKLRLWLSIVVEQDELREEHFEPHPLPNLDMNILVGNSLIDEYEGVKLFDNPVSTPSEIPGKKRDKVMGQLKILFDSDEIFREIFKKQDYYFNERNVKSKEGLKREIDFLRDELIIFELRKKGKIDIIDKYKLIRDHKLKPYFIWELEFAQVFREKGGFDIVIGNPPYVGERGNKDILRSIAETEFGKKYYQGKMDLFYFFFHKAIDIAKDNGEIAFITTNYFPTAYGAKVLRTDIKNRTNIRRLINFNEYKIFESARGQHNLITILKKTPTQNVTAWNSITHRNGVAETKVLNDIFIGMDSETSYYLVNQEEMFEGEENYIRLIGLTDHNEYSIQGILEKMAKSKLKFGDICETKQGIVSGADKVTDKYVQKYSKDWIKGEGIFVLNETEKNSLNLNEYEKTLIKKVYKNSHIKPFYIDCAEYLYVLYVTKDTNIEKIPNIINHLQYYKPLLEKKRETQQGKLPWYSLHWPRDKNIFESPCKIVNPRRCKSNTFALETSQSFEQSDIMVSIINSQYKNQINEKYLLGLLNSKLYCLWLRFKGKLKGDMFELYGTPLSEIPIVLPDIMQQRLMINFVDKILAIKGESDPKLEKEIKILRGKIDILVYDLFNLSENERKIVESNYEHLNN